MKINDSFGKWLRQRRKVLDLTQLDLADQVGCSVVTIRKIEADDRRPSRQITERLADVLAISLEERTEFVSFARRIDALSSAPPLHSAATAPHNLPPQPTSFIGRADELAQIAKRLADPACRLLTLVGAGGIGKTRLALQAAAEQLANFTNGVYFVSLTGVGAPNLVPSTIASALSMSFYGSEAPDVQLVHYLRHKVLLLVLDNFEHLQDATALLGDILAPAPAVKLLTTSRERLNLQEEWVIAIEGLPFPHNGIIDPIESYSAVQLFVQRARQIQANFSLEQNAEAVLSICRNVEGMPLGLELAASWLRGMSCQQIAAQLEHSLDFLATSVHNVPERHRSIRAVFEQSWRLLLAVEQKVLAALSIFRGGFDLEAAEQVTGASPSILVRLADKSLIRLNMSGRYDLQELLRQFAADKLVESGETAAIANKHLDYFLTLAEQVEANIYGPEQIAGFDRLDSEHDNLSAALAWSLSGGVAETGLRLAGALGWFWQLRNHQQEGYNWSTQLLAINSSAPPSVRSKALHRTAELAWDGQQHRALWEKALQLARAAGDKLNIAWSLANPPPTEEGVRVLEEALTIFRELGDGWGISHALRRLGLILTRLGNYERAAVFAEEALALARSAGDKSAEAWSLLVLGHARHAAGDFTRATSLLHESLPMFHEIRDKDGVVFAHLFLAKVAFDQGDDVLARALYQQCLTLMLDIDPRWGWEVCACLVGLGVLAWRRGEAFQAARVLGLAVVHLNSEPGAHTLYFDLDQQMAEVQAQLAEPAFAAAWAEGKTMAPEQAIAYALE